MIKKLIDLLNDLKRTFSGWKTVVEKKARKTKPKKKAENSRKNLPDVKCKNCANISAIIIFRARRSSFFFLRFYLLAFLPLTPFPSPSLLPRSSAKFFFFFSFFAPNVNQRFLRAFNSDCFLFLFAQRKFNAWYLFIKAEQTEVKTNKLSIYYLNCWDLKSPKWRIF